MLGTCISRISTSDAPWLIGDDYIPLSLHSRFFVSGR